MTGPTDFVGPAGPGFVVVANALQLAAACKLPGDKLQPPPQAFAVQEHKELCHDPAKKNGDENK